MLCPNCHSLTPNFKALNKEGRKERKGKNRKQFCVDCGISISDGAKRCRNCIAKLNITEKPVTRNELKALIKTTPFTKIGDEFGVTDSTIRKWCKGYKLPSTKKDIQTYTDEEWELI